MTGTRPPVRFALIGVAGFVARRHLEAIRKVGGDIVAAYDPFDSVGQMNDFPRARFFTDFAEFESYVQRLGSAGKGVDYVTICSPNHLHRAHVEFALRSRAHAICEKPLALELADVDAIERMERETGRSVSTILQLRLNPYNVALKADLRELSSKARIDGDLTYVTSRGPWYYASWKADERRSGGIATNIGVHFYDLLTFFFGMPTRNIVHHRAIDCAAGILEFETARIRWFLSINARDLPADAADRKDLNVACRRLVIGDRMCDLSGDFTQLHTVSYQEILAGRGFTTEHARAGIATVAHIRRATIETDRTRAHPFLARVLADTGRYEDGLPV
jgi:UDP-N-acetyl-2-amino-2-deoxyglucuronate dehydrogenase